MGNLIDALTIAVENEKRNDVTESELLNSMIILCGNRLGRL